MSLPTDVEINRACNALLTTFRDQRQETFDALRAEQIVTGALAGERKLRARSSAPTDGELRASDDDRLIAVMQRRDGQWILERKLGAQGSEWAVR